MAADQDFFLRFGSNAEDFARDVRDEIGGARKELGLLAKEIQNVNRASQGSATAKLVSGIRADIKSAMGDVAKTIGQELRSALRGELKNLNLGDITVTGDPRGGGGGGGRVSSTEVSEADKRAARIKRAAEQSAKASSDAYTKAAREVETILEAASERFESVKAASQELQGDARTALGALSVALNEMKKGAQAARAEEKKLRTNAKRNKPGAARADNTVGANEAAATARELEGRLTNLQNALHDLRSGSLDAAGAIERAVAALESVGMTDQATSVESLGRGRVEQGRPTQPTEGAIDASDFVRAANLQARAANDLQNAVNEFQTHVQAFKAASQDIRITGIEALVQAQAQSRGRTPGQKKTLDDVESEISNELDATVEAGRRNAQAVDEASEAASNEAKARNEAAKAVRGNAARTLDLLNQIPARGLESERELVRSRGLRLPDFSRLQSAMLFSGEAATGGPISGRPFRRPVSGETKTREAVREERTPGDRIDIDEEAVRAEVEALRVLQDVLRAEIDRVETRVGPEEDVREGREEISGLQQEIERLGQAAAAMEDRLSGDPEVRREAEALAQVTQENRRQAAAIGKAIESAVADGLNLQQVETLLSEFPSQIRKAFGERLATIDQMAAQGVGLPDRIDGEEARLAAQARDAEREARELRAQAQQRAAREAAESVGRLGELGVDTQSLSQISKLTGAIPLRGRDIEAQLANAQDITRSLSEQREQLGPGAEEARAEVDRLLKIAANRIETLTRQLNTGVADDRLLRIPRPTTQRPAVSVTRRDLLREQLGREGIPQAPKVAGEIADLFESTAREAFDVQSKLLQQEDARQTLEAVEAGRAAGDVDPETLDKAERSATKALNRIEKEFEEFGGPLARFQQLIGELSSGAVAQERGLGAILQGRSLRELVLEGAAPKGVTDREAELGRAELLARERATAEIARERGLDPSAGIEGLREALDPQELKAARARIKEEVAQAVTNYKRQQEAADRAREAGERYAPILERIAGLMTASTNVDEGLIRRRVEEEGLRGPSGRQAALRSFMAGEGGDDRRVIDALGGLDAAIRRATQHETGFARPPEFNVERARAEFDELNRVRSRIGIMESIETPMDPQHDRNLRDLRKAEENLIKQINQRAKNVAIANEKRREFDRQAEQIAAQVRGGDLSRLRPVAEERIETLRSPEQRALRLRAIGQEAGLTEGQVAGVTTAQELLELVAALRENSTATRGDVAATEQSIAATKQLEASTKEATHEARQRVARLSIGDQAGVAEFLAGGRVPADKAGRRPLEQLGIRAGQFQGSTLDDIFAKAEGQIGLSGRKASTRGILSGLVGEAAPETLTQDFLDKARLAAEDLRAAAAQQRGVLDEIQARSEGAQDERLITVLNELSGAIKRLSECCAVMQSAVRGGGFGTGLSKDKEIARQRGTAGAEQIIGVQVQRDITRALREAVAAATPEARRRALGQAALAAKGDVSLGLDDSTVVGVIQRLFSGLGSESGGTATEGLTNQDVAAIQSGLLQLKSVLDAGGKAAAEAFQAGDMRAAAEAMVAETRDVDRTLSVLRNAFDVTEDDIKALRPALERFEQGLAEAAAAPKPGEQGFIGPVRPTQESIDQGILQRSSLFEFFGRDVDTSDASEANVTRASEDALSRLNKERVDEVTFMQRLQDAFGALDRETQELIQKQVRAKNAALEQAQANETFARSLAQTLPQGEQQRFLGALGTAPDEAAAGAMVNDFAKSFEKATGQGTNSRFRRALSKMFQGIDLNQEGRTAVDNFARAGLTQLTTYRTPFQHLIASLFRGQSILQATLSQAGFAISRFLGGSVVFGAVNQLQEFGRIALETEQTFVRITAALEATGREAEGLRRGFQDIAVSTNTSLDDIVESGAQLVGVFETTQELLDATELVGQLDLVSQGALNATEGFRSLSAVTAAFQEQLVDERGFTDSQAIQYVGDLAVRIQDLSGVNIEDTVEGLARLGETAVQLGIEMEMIASVTAQTVKASGQTGQTVSEQFGRILANFQKGEVQNLLVRLGVTDQATISAGDFNQVMTDLLKNFNDLSGGDRRSIANLIGDPRQFALTNTLLSQGTNALQLYEDSLNNAGAAAERSEEVLGTLRGQLGQMNKQIQTFVQNLIDLGVLNIFGVMLEAARPLLETINNILQTINDFKDASPFGKMAIDLGMVVASMYVLRSLVQGMTQSFHQMQGMQQGPAGSGGIFSTFLSARRRGREQRRQLRAPNRYLGATPVYGPTPTGAPLAPLPGSGLSGRTLRSTIKNSRAMGKVTETLQSSVAGLRKGFEGLRRPLARFGYRLRRMAPSIITGALAIGFLIEHITRKSRELQEFFESVGPQSAPEREPGESEGEFEERKVLEENLKKADEVRGTFGELTSYVTDSWLNASAAFLAGTDRLLGGLIGLVTPRGVSSAEEDVFGSLSGDSPERNELLDRWQAIVANLEDNLVGTERVGLPTTGGPPPGLSAEERQRWFENAAEGLSIRMGQIDEDYEEAIEAASTAQEKARLLEDWMALKDLMRDLSDEAVRLSKNFQGLDLSLQEITDAVTAIDSIEGITAAEMNQVPQLVDAIMGPNLTENTKSVIAPAFAGGGFLANLENRRQVLEDLLREAELEFEQVLNSDDAGTEDVEEARKLFEDRARALIDFNRSAIQSVESAANGFAELAIRFGDFDEAAIQLDRALAAVEKDIARADVGSPEEAEAIQRKMEILRRKAETSVGEQVAALELAAVGLEDPIAGIGNQLESLQLKLESAAEFPGSYSAEEVRGFMKEIADLQKQIGDEQERIASAYDEYLASTANNEIARTALEYQGALRRYRRAIETDAGAAAITEAATEVNEAARAQRDAAEALRAARAEVQIARIPEGDSLSRSLAELREAYRKQAAVIKEFGRDSVEFAQAITDIIDIQRGAEEAARDAADSVLELAQSLAAAAGLDIRGARLSVQQAEAAVRRAIQDSGGDTDTAAVRRELAGLVDAQAAMRDTILSEALETVDFMLNMEDITEQQAIQVLQQIADTADLTEDQRRDLLSRIKQLKDSINEGVSEQFNLGEIRIPTPFEVRRALKVEEITQGLQDSVDAVTDLDAPTLPGDRVGPAPEGLLESILGPDLASEVLGLGATGGNISDEIRNLGRGLSGDLLPPLSQIPRIIDAQLSTRDELISRSNMQIQTLVANNERLNASVNQIGPTVTAPLAAIQEAEEYGNELLTDANNALLDANVYLSRMAKLALDRRDDFRYWANTVGNNDTYDPGSLAENEMRAIQQAVDQNYRPPARDTSQQQTTIYHDVVNLQIDGTDTGMVEKVVQDTVGTKSIQRESISTGRVL